MTRGSVKAAQLAHNQQVGFNSHDRNAPVFSGQDAPLIRASVVVQLHSQACMIDLEKLGEARMAAVSYAVAEFEEDNPRWFDGGAAAVAIAYMDDKWVNQLLFSNYGLKSYP